MGARAGCPNVSGTCFDERTHHRRGRFHWQPPCGPVARARRDGDGPGLLHGLLPAADEGSQRGGQRRQARLPLRRGQPAARPTWTRLLDDKTHVFHLAAQAGVRKSWGRDFQVYTANNIDATQRLLEACVGRPIEKLVYASSSSVYGDEAAIPMRETQVPHPVSPYGVTKLAAEQLCHLYAVNHGVPATSLRYFTVYGPRQRPDMAFRKFLTRRRRRRAAGGLRRRAADARLHVRQRRRGRHHRRRRARRAWPRLQHRRRLARVAQRRAGARSSRSWAGR